MKEALGHFSPGIDPTLTTAVAAPVVVVLVWLFLRRIRARIMQDHEARA